MLLALLARFTPVAHSVGSAAKSSVLLATWSLILFFSGGEIEFTSASQAVSTNAKCGLIPQLIDNIRD